MGRYASTRLRSREPELEPVTEVSVIPVIDISLVLLVILFVTAPLLSYPSLPIRLPKARGEDGAGRAVQVTLTAEGRLAVGSREVEWPAFGDLLRQELARPHEGPVVLRVDKSVPYRDVQRLLGEALKAGAPGVAFGTEPPR